MAKKILKFIFQVITTAVLFSAVYWLFKVIFDKTYSFSYEYLLQGLIFAIMYVPLMRWHTTKFS